MTVLNSYQVGGEYWGAIIMTILMIACILASIINYSNGEDYAGIGFLMGSIACFIAAFYLFFVNKDSVTRYEVIIDENYSVQELYENYEVVDQRGDILIVEEKSE